MNPAHKELHGILVLNHVLFNVNHHKYIIGTLKNVNLDALRDNYLIYLVETVIINVPRLKFTIQHQNYVIISVDPLINGILSYKNAFVKMALSLLMTLV